MGGEARRAGRRPRGHRQAERRRPSSAGSEEASGWLYLHVEGRGGVRERRRVFPAGDRGELSRDGRGQEEGRDCCSSVRKGVRRSQTHGFRGSGPETSGTRYPVPEGRRWTRRAPPCASLETDTEAGLRGAAAQAPGREAGKTGTARAQGRGAAAGHAWGLPCGSPGRRSRRECCPAHASGSQSSLAERRRHPWTVEGFRHPRRCVSAAP